MLSKTVYVAVFLLGLGAVISFTALANSQLESKADPQPKEAKAKTEEKQPEGKEAEAEQGEEEKSDKVQGSSQVTAEELLEQFQKDRPTNVPIPPVSSTDDESPGIRPPTDGGNRLPDGFFLIDRAGRAIKDGDWWVFVFEGYSESHPEPPMKLLPNQLLERMVLETESAPAGTVFVVSGEVTEFMGENYLLLRKLLRQRDLGNLEK